jgi:hypothetical protein
MAEVLRAEFKLKFDEAFAPPRPCLRKFYHGVIDALVSPFDTLIAVDEILKCAQREQLNVLLNVQAELEVPKMAKKAWEKLYHDAKWAFEGCFILVDYVRLYCANDKRLFDMSKLYPKYPEIGYVGAMEAGVLLKYTNVMVAALSSTKAVGHKAMLIDVCARISEEASATNKYKRGGGGTQKVMSSIREIIYEGEGGVDPKLCRELRGALIERLAALYVAATAGKAATAKKGPSSVTTPTSVGNKRPAPHTPLSVTSSGDAAVQQTLSPIACGGVACSGMGAEKVAKRQRVTSPLRAPDATAKAQPALPTLRTADVKAAIRALHSGGRGGAAEEWRILAAIGGWKAGDLQPEPESA